jgi:hypothetical protein
MSFLYFLKHKAFKNNDFNLFVRLEAPQYFEVF